MNISKFQIFQAMLIMFLFSSLNGQIEKVSNPLKDIKSCEGKVKLTLIKEWGGEKAKSEALLFSEPVDIEVGEDGLVFILDSSIQKIKVFDSSTEFVRSIGRKGKGPAEFSYPIDLALDSQNNVVVSDAVDRRIQVFTSNGDYIEGFKLADKNPGYISLTSKNEVVMYSGMEFSETSALLSIFNYKGNVTGQIGKMDKEESSLLRNFKYDNFFALDNQDNFYVGYKSKPVIEKYATSGELISRVFYELPFEVPEIKARGSSIEGEIILAGLSIDEEGRIYLVTTTRLKETEEKKSGMKVVTFGREQSVKMTDMKRNLDSDSTDIYQLLVFDTSGKIIALTKLNIHCNKIKVYKNHLFVVDSYEAAKIYEYRISFE